MLTGRALRHLGKYRLRTTPCVNSPIGVLSHAQTPTTPLFCKGNLSPTRTRQQPPVSARRGGVGRATEQLVASAWNEWWDVGRKIV